MVPDTNIDGKMTIRVASVSSVIDPDLSKETTASSSPEKVSSPSPLLEKDIYIKKSSLEGAGGGAFASRVLPANHRLSQYTGIPVKAKEMRASGYIRGYIMRVGGPYIDARDPDGLLMLQDGREISVHQFTDADWASLDYIGVGWRGAANLSRFINQASGDAEANVVYRDGWWTTTKPVDAHQELLVSSYGSDFW